MIYKFITRLLPGQKAIILMCLDLSMVLLAFALSTTLMNGAGGVWPDLARKLPFIGIGLAVSAICIRYLGLHRTKLKIYEAQGMTDTILVAGALAVSCGAVNLLVGRVMTLADISVLGALALVLMIGARLILLEVVRYAWSTGSGRMRILIYGAGQTGRQFANALATDDKVLPMAFVDDSPRLQSQTISGLRVHSSVQIEHLVQSLGIDRVVLAMPSAAPNVRARIANRLKSLGCEVHSLPSFSEIIAKGEQALDRPPVDMANLLGRNRLEQELPGVTDSYKGRTILVTGAGGSIGSELCRQLALCDPAVLVLLDHSELALYDIAREMAVIAPDLKVVPRLGSINEATLLREIFAEHQVQIVLHAAAYKHLPLVQSNVIEGIRNNVIGTKIVAEEAGRAGVSRFILISTDKAVRPSSVMGATKRLAELVVQDLATRAKSTRYSMVRFGNVMGSSGSVIPLFEEQIARGGPITVTHPDVTRYFMTISEASRLVLLAGSFARGGDVFVLDMGTPQSIRDVAQQMIEGAGYTLKDDMHPHGDIEIVFTGLRPGEKLHEELLIGSDMLTTPHPKIMRAQETHLSEIELAKAIAEIRAAIDSRDGEFASSVLSAWVEKQEQRSIEILT
ncbi:polysaccharide biosynthesis protein [Pseudooceanicola sp. C21-150M6]|uniref:polysaccharide biosynthesis protein n=1 Tax=Pseudooceanicola sp. C21-150M6 TaxID=3434355 RepID=UPI003D7FDE7F